MPYVYGIRVSKGNKGDGISVTGLSTHVEIAHTEIDSTFSNAILCRAAPQCDGSTTRETFLMEDIRIHDNFIHDVNGEGVSVGSIFYANGKTVYCSGSATTILPHLIDGVRIYQNEIQRAGLEGIQVFSASHDVEVYQNSISYYGQRNQGGENAGIHVGTGTTGRFYANTVKDGNGTGIEIHGLGNITVDNNQIIRAGENYFPENQSLEAHGILVDDGSTQANNFYHFINNTIISPKTDGIRFASTLSAQNQIQNNLIVAPGAYEKYNIDSTSTQANDAYVYLTANQDIGLTSNYFTLTNTNLGFINASEDNFALSASSQLIDAGTPLTSHVISTDFVGVQRETNLSTDIGAFEFIPTQNSLDCGCDVIIGLDVTQADGNNYTYNPGATICIVGGQRNALSLTNWTGSETQPLSFINCGGAILISNDDTAFGLHLHNIQYAAFSATPTIGFPYGLTITQTQTGGHGVLVDGNSHHIELTD
ncbi:MAG: right-handed parallel beta-helix repeat-containing protein, partial [Bacteroidota bacterium]